MTEIQNIISKYRNRIILVNYPGALFYCSSSLTWLTEAEIKWCGVPHSYMLAYLKDNVANVEMTLEAGFGDYWFSVIEKNIQSFSADYEKEINARRKTINSFLAHAELAQKKNYSLFDLLNKIISSTKILIDTIVPYNIAPSVDSLLQAKIKELLKDQNITLTEEELTILTVSRGPSAVLRHDDKILECVKYLLKHNRTFSFSQIMNDSHAAALAKDAWKQGYFIYSGYGGVKLWSLEDECKLIVSSIEKLADLEKQQSRRLVDNERLGKTLSVYHFSDELKNHLDLARKLSLLRDERKELQQKMFYYQALVLEEIAKTVDIPRNDLEYLRYNEFTPDIFTNLDTVKNTVANRRIAFLSIWSQETGHSFYEGLSADENYKKYSLKHKNLEQEELKELRGQVGSPGVARGPVRVVLNTLYASDFKEGSVLVTAMTSPEFVPLMKKSVAIVTELGGITCHAAIVARELGKPCIIGTKIATQVLKDGDLVEVDANRGIVRKIS